MSRQQVEALLETIASDGDVLGDKSIVPAEPAEGLEQRLDAMLAEIDKLTIDETIGVGGRGVVRRAEQLGLRRDVVVKTVRGEPDELALVELLQEALVTGSLEHPNIVPIHYIGIGDDGVPFIVLKKIEGVPWSEQIAEEDLDRNLQILLDVIDAVRFAHSRAIIHRDLKPANVMVGEFGEVYVLDWGLAVSLDDDIDWLPRASEVSGVAGTLTYMAPEMLSAGELSERTDVYLLGAVLCEIATGRAPHRGTNLTALAESIAASDPDLGGEVPEELALIIRRAMAPEPANRYASATELKLALEAFLVHREAARLADHANHRLEALLAACAGDDVDRDQLYNIFGECRFGFREAMRRWPEGPAAAGLERAVTAVVEHELERGEAAAAERLLSELPAVPPQLRARVAAARDDERARREALERVVADHDPGRGGRARAIAAIAVGLITLTAFAATPSLWPRFATPTWTRFLLITLIGGLALGVVGFIMRRALRVSFANRLLAIAVAVGWMATVTVMAAQWMADSDPGLMRSFHPIIWFCCVSVLAGAVDRRLWPSAVMLLGVSLVVPSIHVRASVFVLTGAAALMFGNVGYVSWQRARERADPEDR